MKTTIKFVLCFWIGSVAFISTNAFADYSTIETVCLDDYEYTPLSECINSIQRYFDVSTRCGGVEVSASSTVPTLSAQVSTCGINHACALVAAGAGEGGSGGGGCGLN